MDDCDLHGNTGGVGGALLVRGGEAKVTRSRLEGNRAAVRGGALVVEGGSVSLGDRTILFGNVAPAGASDL